MEIKEKKDYIDMINSYLEECKSFKNKYNTSLLGKDFIVYPNVFSPRVFDDPKFFLENLVIPKASRFLEIGCGTGVISVYAAINGAKEVYAVDINPDAVQNTEENACLHNVSDKIKVFLGDVFDPIPKEERFDVVFWNVPFIYVKNKPASFLEKSVFDHQYRGIGKYFKCAENYLNETGKLSISFSSSSGHKEAVDLIAENHGWRLRIVAKTVFNDGISVELYNAVKHKQQV